MCLFNATTVSNISSLSGLVPGTRCQSLAGAQAPVAPALTMTLSRNDIVVISSVLLNEIEVEKS